MQESSTVPKDAASTEDADRWQLVAGWLIVRFAGSHSSYGWPGALTERSRDRSLGFVPSSGHAQPFRSLERCYRGRRRQRRPWGAWQRSRILVPSLQNTASHSGDPGRHWDFDRCSFPRPVSTSCGRRAIPDCRGGPSARRHRDSLDGRLRARIHH